MRYGHDALVCTAWTIRRCFENCLNQPVVQRRRRVEQLRVGKHFQTALDARLDVLGSHYICRCRTPFLCTVSFFVYADLPRLTPIMTIAAECLGVFVEWYGYLTRWARFVLDRGVRDLGTELGKCFVAVEAKLLCL